MSEKETEFENTPPPRKRGAPKGNRNAWKHGRRSASAKGERAAVRAEILDRLPDASILFSREASRTLAMLVGEGAQISANKTNNSVARNGEEEGVSDFSTNKPNNSASPSPEGAGVSGFPTNKANNSLAAARTRGAPKGNRNALKHGRRCGKRRAFDAGLRTFIRRVHLLCDLAVQGVKPESRRPS